MKKEILKNTDIKQTQNVETIMSDVNARLSKLKNSSDLDNVIKNLLPKISGDNRISAELKKFINKE